MILKSRGKDYEAFAFEMPPIPRPSQWGSAVSYSGRNVVTSEAAGLPAFLRAVRLLSETTSQQPLRLYREVGEDREVVTGTPQVKLLRRPNDEMTGSQVWEFAVASMVCAGKFMAIKVKVRGEVKALFPLDPRLVGIKVEDGKLVFKVRSSATSAEVKTFTREDILYIPGILLDSPLIGVSVIENFRHSLGTYLDRQEFESRYLKNDAGVGVVLKHAGNVLPDQREEIRAGFEARQQGAGNAGRPAVIWGGWEIDRLPISARDAQFVESAALSVREIARMTGVPAGLLDDPDAPGNIAPEHENMRFLTYGLAPWQTRIEQGLRADPDILKDDDLCVEFDNRELLRPDLRTRMEAAHRARQAGIATANELRPDFGLSGDHPDGNVLLATPVGGAPNTPAADGSAEPDTDDTPTE